MTSMANECIGFLYREILSQLIESSLLLKKEQTQRNYYLKLTLQPHQTKDTQSGSNSTFDSDHDYFFQSITPSEIMETCRRCLLRKNSTIVNKFHRNVEMKSEKSRLLFF
jgi:hypothetical protein